MNHQSISSVTQSCPTLHDPVDCSTPGLPVHRQHLEFTEIQVHWVSDAMQLAHLLPPLLVLHSAFPASGSFSVNGFFSSGHQSIRASAPASIPPMNIQGWFALRSTGLVPLQSKGFSSVFSSTTIRHQFFRTQPSLWSATFHVPISYRHFLFGKKFIQFYPFFKLGCLFYRIPDFLVVFILGEN